MLTSPDRGETVVLRKRKLKIEIAWGDIVAFVARKKRIVWAIVVLGAVACIVTIFVGRADIARLYPTSCLGGWNETGNAEGVPDVAVGDPPEMFTERNSAFLHNAVGLMYCGGFSGDLPLDANIVATSLKLSLVIEPYTPDVETIPTSTLIQIIIPEDFSVPSSTASTTPGDDVLIDGSSTTDDGQHRDFESPDLEPAAPPEATSSGSSMHAPRAKSFLHALVTQRVRAQESGGDETDIVPVEDQTEASTTAAEPSATSSSPDSGTSTENRSSGDQEQNSAFPDQQQFSSATETVVQETALPVLEVSYTIDGSSWMHLGYIAEREGTSGVSFDIPPLNLDKIANLQVSVATMQMLDASFSIFLDGMWIEAQYSHEASSLLSGVEVQNLPREEVDPTEIFKNFKKDFQSHENVEFEIDIFGAGATSTTELNVSSTTSSSSLPEADTSTPVFIEPLPPLPSSTSSPTSSPTSWLRRRFFDFARFFSLAGTQTLARQNGIVDVEFRGPDGGKASLDYEIIRGGQTATVRVKRNSRSFRPGKYQIIVSVLRSGKVVTASKDFTWGVLAINVNKSIYPPNETVYLQMAVLRDDGRTVCNANLKLEIVSPGGVQSAVSVERSEECGPNNVTDVPDYFAYHQIGGPGIYQMKLTNLDNGYEITDSFEVREEVPFDVERIGPTRIYPPAGYGMTLRIKANQDFQGQVVENVPILFEILNPGSGIPNEFQIRNSNDPDTKQIIWRVDWKAGESYELKYQFDAPDVSPYLYLLGPLKFSDSLNWLQKLLSGPEGGIIFQEMRQWQTASDQTAPAPSFGTHWHGEATSTSVAVTIDGGTNGLYLAFVSTKSGSPVLNSVSGGGLTWNTPTKAKQCSGRDQTSVSWAWARGTPTSGSQVITFSMSATASLAAAVIRIDNAPNSQIEANVFEDVTGRNTIGENDTGCTVGVDGTAMPFIVDTAGADRLIVSVTNDRAYTMTQDADHTLRFNYSAGSGGDISSIWHTDRTVATSTSYSDEHTSSSAADWSLISLAIKSDKELPPDGVGTDTNFTVPGKVFFDDYETGNHNNWTGTTVSGTGSLAEVLSTNPYAGTYAGHYYRTSASDLGNQALAYRDFTAPAGNIVWAKGYFRFDSIPSSTYSTVNNVLSLSTTNLDQTKARFNAYNSNVLRCNYLNKDGTWYGSTWGTSLTTGSYYALKIKFDRSGANPVITWYVNGSQICTTTDTTTGTAYTPTRVRVGSILDTGISYPDSWYTGTADTRADNVGVYSSDPDLLGCTYNWECELTDDGDTSYVLSTAAQIDLYSVQNHGAGSGTINSVTVYIVAKRNDTSLRSVATELRTNGANYAGSSNILGDTYTTYSTVYITNPSTTLAWTWAEVDAMEIGCNAGTTAVKCTRVYAVVDYTISNGPPSIPTLAETPTFTNMQTNDTTPVLGNFSTTDPESENVEYEIQWDEDYNFGSPVTKTSSNYPTDTGWTAATFTSGSSTAYTIQAGDALTNGQTYWWRVRARDPSGSNTWSSYSTKRSITINTSLTADRWFQTTGDQFGTDVLTETATTTDGVKLKGW